MKNLAEIKSDIEKIEKKVKMFGIPHFDQQSKEEKKLGKELRRLTDLYWFIKTEPSEEFLKTTLKGLEKKLKIIKNGYDLWLANVCDPDVINKKGTYENLMEVKKIKYYIDTLKYLLK